MIAFIIRRLLQALAVMVTVAFIAFMLFQYVGDPVANMLGQDATPEQRLKLRSDLGLDRPFPVQFMRFMGNAVQGEFGLSLRQGRKVSVLIAESFPATLELAMLAALIGLLLGIPLGGVCRAQAWLARRAAGDDGLAVGGVAAHLPDRHPADPGFRRCC